MDILIKNILFVAEINSIARKEVSKDQYLANLFLGCLMNNEKEENSRVSGCLYS
jgi:hypothetical protein